MIVNFNFDGLHLDINIDPTDDSWCIWEGKLYLGTDMAGFIDLTSGQCDEIHGRYGDIIDYRVKEYMDQAR